MKKTDNTILSVAVAIISKEFSELKGHVQSAALVEASQRILELDEQVKYCSEVLAALSHPELIDKDKVALLALVKLRDMQL